MTEVEFFDDPAQALAVAGPFLESRPVEHNLILTLLHERAATNEPGRYWAVRDGHRVVGVAFQSPAHFPITVTPMAADAVETLVAAVVALPDPPPGVNGEVATVARFTGHWTERTKSAARPVEGSRIYELRALRPPAPPAGGLRRARPDERDLLFAWAEDFAAGAPMAEAPRLVDGPLAHGRMWVWDDDGPVSMTAHTEPLAGVTRVFAVYTPPDLRNRGYASACVGAISRQLVDAGQTCMLYTDLSNPVSNSVYRRLGYEAVCEVVRYEFTPGRR